MVRIEAALGAGTPFPDALEAERHRLADPLADRVLITLAAAHRTGGATVSALLERLASSVAEELRVRKAHDADLTQQRLTAAVALLAPWGLLVLTILTNAQAAAAYRTERGSIVILVGLAATAGGHLLSRRTARLSRAPRVFT
jgi:tight adherence protein B